jgi:PAS domain S-box-containing protein
LEKRIRELNVEIEEANGKLRRNLQEKEKVQAYLSTLLESLPVGVIGTDRRGNIHSCNRRAAEILEESRSMIEGRHIREVLKGSESATALQEVLQEGFAVPKTFETLLGRASDGRRRILRLQIVPAGGADEGEAAGVVLVEDVTDIRRLEHQASRNSRLAAMGEIAMNVAHEIRNPLGSIELFASMLQHDLAGDPINGPLAVHICKGVRCVDHIVANILQFARPQRLAYTLFDLDELIDETLVFAEHALRLKNIRVERDHAQAESTLWADAELLKQMFLNLFLNAVQATPEGGVVGVRTLPNGKTVEVQVWDTGCGFAPGMIGKIFDPFFTTRRRGTGLGLTIVHNILSAHNGSIEADNRPEGGAVFTIILPKKIPPRFDDSSASASSGEAEAPDAVACLEDPSPEETTFSPQAQEEPYLCQPEF